MAFKEPFEQEGDPFLYQTLNGGEVTAEDGFLQMTGGLPTAVYLSLFGGNYEDDARKSNPNNWWGNVLETDTVSQYRSETQNLLELLTPIPASLQRIQAAATRDLQWLLDKKIASSVSIVVTMPALNTIKMEIVIQADGEEQNFEFVENWRAGGFEPILRPLSPEWHVTEDYAPRLSENGDIIVIEG